VSRIKYAATLLCALILGCGAPDQPAGKSPDPAAQSPGQWLVVNYWAEWCKPCIEEIPHPLVLAVIATEDRSFYEHWGIQPSALIRADTATRSSRSASVARTRPGSARGSRVSAVSRKKCVCSSRRKETKPRLAPNEIDLTVFHPDEAKTIRNLRDNEVMDIHNAV